MYLATFQLLGTEDLAYIRAALSGTDWAEGKGSAGYLAQSAKVNWQLPPDHPTAVQLGNAVIEACNSNEQLLSFSLPLRYAPPQFSSYQDGHSYGRHFDGAIRPVPDGGEPVRTDLAATVFLSEQGAYEGGELCIEEGQTRREVKLAAGQVCIYSSRYVHEVKPVTSGNRLAAFFWIQSMVRSDAQRQILYELDQVIQRLGSVDASDANAMELANVYHNLLREWAET